MFNSDENEFDIQKTILKKKELKVGKFYIEYEKLTNRILGVTPEKITINDYRKDLLEIDENDLIRDIFNNKVPLHKLKIRYDYESNTRILYRHYDPKRWEFDYIRGTKDSNNFIHFYCDIVSKKIIVNFIDYNFMREFTKEKINELNLSQLPEYIDIFCIDKYEPSKLFDTLPLDLKSLFKGQEQRFHCYWLPDVPEEFEKIDFLHYNHDIKITVDKEPMYVPVANIQLKPTIVYKQTGNKLQVQSIMNDTRNFQLDEIITFYLFDFNDPGQILDTISLNTSSLDNFNLVEFKLKTKKPIKMISNYSHLYIEDSNVSTYYQF